MSAAETCRFCRRPIAYKKQIVEPGFLPRGGWADDSPRDPFVCFRALHYAHVPERIKP